MKSNNSLSDGKNIIEEKTESENEEMLGNEEVAKIEEEQSKNDSSYSINANELSTQKD